MHRLFIDQNVRTEIAWALREDGHDVVHASEIGSQEHDDESIYQWAQQKALTILTFDVDFAERARWAREPHNGIIRLRLEPQTPNHVLPVIRKFLAEYPPEKLKNTLVILTENKVRIRRR